MVRHIIIGACAVVILAGLWFFLQPKSLEKPLINGSLSYHLSVTAGVVAGPAILVAREGYPVEIAVTADQADLLHLHGYELQQPVVAGEVARLLFNADLAGRYLLELENSGIPLASLEVYPR
jgi:hypothetical protein